MTTFVSFGLGETATAVRTAPVGVGISPAGRVGKRAFDVTTSVLALAVLFPVLLLVALLVRLDSRGPVFFTQVRVGENGRLFRIFKFRTMRVDADDAFHTAYVEALIKGEAQMQDGM